MFEFVQKHKRWLQTILLILIVPSFALLGVDFYFRDGSAGGSLAKVGDARITEVEYSQALRQAQDRMREMMKDNPDPSVLNSPQLKESVLNELVEQKATLVQAGKSGMRVSAAELQKIIAGVEAFRDESGRFSRERYRQLLQSQGMSPEAFEAQLRTNILLQQVRGVYADSAFMPDSVVERLARIGEQEREVSQVVFNPADYVKKATASAADVEKYYADKKVEFQIPERARIEYVILSLDAAQRALQIPDADLKKFYDENITRYQTPEERSASHILITVPAAASADEKSKAKARAEDLLRQIKAAPAQFGELARKNSQDPGSAEKGGDLGSFGRGMMVKPFDEAAFAMKVGEIAGPVESQYGYHIIRLDAIKPVQTTPFDKVRSEIAEEVRKTRAGKAFAEAAENFGNLVYEQFDSLQPAADALKLTIQKSDWVSRGGGNMNPLLNNEKLLAALFSDEVVKNKHNTGAIEVEPNTLLSARVIEHQPVTTLPLAEVREDIQRHLTETEAVKLAEKEGQVALEKLRQGQSPSLPWSAPQAVTLQKRQGLHAQGAQAVFGADVTKLPAYAGVSAPQGRFVVYRISKVKDVEAIDPEKRKALAKQLGQMAGQEQYVAFLASLRERLDVSIDRKKLDQGS